MSVVVDAPPTVRTTWPKPSSASSTTASAVGAPDRSTPVRCDAATRATFDAHRLP